MTGHVAWTDVRGNAVMVDTWRTAGSVLVIAGWSGPQNVALARWARLLRGEKHSRNEGALGHTVIPCQNHLRFVSKIDAVPGWIHLVLVHRDALDMRSSKIVEHSVAFGLDEQNLDARVRRIVEVPMRQGWGTEIGLPKKLVNELPGIGRRAWSIQTEAKQWVDAVSEHALALAKVAS